ncbi:MAG: heavy metal translocating P-type ATPase, partial [Methylocystaceae bacterium]
MMVAVIGAAVIGELSEAATVVFLFALGNGLQVFTNSRTMGNLKALLDQTPEQALVREGQSEELLPVELIKVGSLVIVKPGEKLPMDGEVINGSSEVNQAPLTGESEPVYKGVGDHIYAGCINGNGTLEIKVTVPAAERKIARLVALVEEAQAQKAPFEQMIDRFARYYTPIVISLAALVAVVPPLLGGGWHHWIYQGLALLLVGCPCALVISTPVSIVAAIGSAARHGVLIKNGASLEALASCNTVAFDKTGTLTTGHFQVTGIYPRPEIDQREFMRIAAGLEARSEHLLGQSILRWADENSIVYEPTFDYQALPGMGAEGTIDGKRYFIGGRRLLEEKGVKAGALEDLFAEKENDGQTIIALGSNQELWGVITVADQVRSNTGTAIEKMHRMGLTSWMLTGDNINAAAKVASTIEVDQFWPGLLP